MLWNGVEGMKTKYKCEKGNGENLQGNETVSRGTSLHWHSSWNWCFCRCWLWFFLRREWKQCGLFLSIYFNLVQSSSTKETYCDGTPLLSSSIELLTLMVMHRPLIEQRRATMPLTSARVSRRWDGLWYRPTQIRCCWRRPTRGGEMHYYYYHHCCWSSGSLAIAAVVSCCWLLVFLVVVIVCCGWLLLLLLV